jgi:hypothetical protein
VVAGVWIYADSETGALYAVNPGGVGSTPVQILIYGSLPLGGRSVKREAVRRSYRPALGLTGIYLWLTAGRCALTTALGRRVGVGESLSGVLHSATGINGFQSSGAAAVGFYGQAAMTGTTFPWVPGAAGRVYPALRVYAAGAQPWKTNLTAGTYEFLHKGPCTFIYVLTCLVDRPWDAGTTATSTRWPLVKNHYGTVGFELAIDSETGVPIWVRMDTAESVFMARTPVKDGRTHWITVRQTATAGDLEIYVDGVLDTTGICTTITNNAAGQLMLASVAPGCSYGVASTGYTMAAHDLHEMIAISGSLPDAQLAQIHAELARTYGSEA